MNALGSPIEALAFDYLSYGVLTAVSNIWTVVALFTAVFSFWRIKIRSVDVGSRICHSTSASASPPPAIKLSPPTEIESVAECSGDLSECWGRTKSGKFVLYYNVDDVNESEDLEGDEGNGNCEFNGGAECWDFGSVLKVKRGEGSWYGYQDLTVLDGNVVRFWEGCSRNRNGVSF